MVTVTWGTECGADTGFLRFCKEPGTIGKAAR